MRLGIYIAHAAWSDRRASLDRLLSQVDATVVQSEAREHASTWATRLYQRALDDAPDFACFLNDDVFVCPEFRATLEAMHAIRPHDVLALHTTFPQARAFADAEQRWVRAYWLTGPAYSMPLGALRRLVDYRSALPRWFIESRNEDNVAMQWAWHEQRPIWHPLPAVVKHDVTVPSSLGYDHHPMRQPLYSWEDATGAELTVPSYWMPRGVPICIECPWMSTNVLEMYRQQVSVT